jgi:hypothetical protein
LVRGHLEKSQRTINSVGMLRFSLG